MALLQEIRTWIDTRPYLENLKGTVLRDVWPLLNVSGSAPFAISREVLCYLDHLSYLYSAKRKVRERFKDFLKQVMSGIDPNYCKRAEEIYRIYRNGPVHEFDPKVLKNTEGQLLLWLVYKGNRSDSIEIQGQSMKVTHLEPVRSPGSQNFWLPISTVCLIIDLVSSIDAFQKEAREDERVTTWNRAVRKLNRPECFDFKIT